MAKKKPTRRPAQQAPASPDLHLELPGSDLEARLWGFEEYARHVLELHAESRPGAVMADDHQAELARRLLGRVEAAVEHGGAPPAALLFEIGELVGALDPESRFEGWRRSESAKAMKDQQSIGFAQRDAERVHLAVEIAKGWPGGFNPKSDIMRLAGQLRRRLQADDPSSKTPSVRQLRRILGRHRSEIASRVSLAT